MARKKPEANEVEELDRAYTSITGYKPKHLRSKPRKQTPLPRIFLGLLLILVLTGTFFITVRYGTLLDGALKMKDVTVGGISLNGLTKKEAKAALDQIPYGQETMVIRVADTTLELVPGQIGIVPETGKAVDEAYRTGATGKFSLVPYLNLDQQAIQAAVDTLGKQYNTEFEQTVTAFTGRQPSLESGSEEGSDGMTLTVTLGSPDYGLDTQALYQQILDAYDAGRFLVEAQYTHLEPEMPDLDALYAQTYIAPVDAVMDATTFDVSPDSYGYGFDLESAKAQLSQATYGETLEIPFFRIPPKVTAAELSSGLFCDVLGEAKTPYFGNDDNNRNTNLRLACEALNGLVLLPGETFSYNEALGERTAKKGYKEAPSYAEGLTVDSLGGGICQVSSTLYYSTLFADLEIVKRYNHSYLSDYIDPGMDATVTWGGADFLFRNNTNFPIRIEAWRAEGYVNVRIIGTDERDYYIKMTYNILRTEEYETVYREMEADNEKKYKDGDVIVTPYKGATVKAYKQKFSKETDEMISSEAITTDTYKKRDKVICKIVDSTAPTGDAATDATQTTTE